MLYVAALLFGLTHPGSKLLLDTGLDLVSFCLLALVFRVVIQAPLLAFRAKSGAGRAGCLLTKADWALLGLIGLVGASLQVCEFAGVKAGLPIPLVTFLVYTHPVWAVGLAKVINREKIGATGIIAVLFAFSGLFFIAGVSGGWSFQASWLAPLAAGFLIALWVSLSNAAKKSGISSVALAFYYDLFALIALAALRFSPVLGVAQTSLGAWLSSAPHVAMIAAYALLAGVVPNLLFYQAQAKNRAQAAALVLLFEPVISSALSHLIWHDQLSKGFVMGAALILMAALPLREILGWMKKPALVALAFVGFALTSHAKDGPGVHGFLVFGTSHVYASHLPMFHAPHAYQVVIELGLDPETRAAYLADVQAHPGEIYTIVPEPFVLPDVIRAETPFKADLYRGHFERGGVVIRAGVHVAIAQTLVNRPLVATSARPSNYTAFVVGDASESFLVHKITARPNFDEIVKNLNVSGTSEVTFARPDEPLHSSEVIYSETGDLQ